jgi:hypothetical protein
MREEHAKAKEMSAWCKKKGMVYDYDYKWYFDHKRCVTYFSFRNDSSATMFVLQWT